MPETLIERIKWLLDQPPSEDTGAELIALTEFCRVTVDEIPEYYWSNFDVNGGHEFSVYGRSDNSLYVARGYETGHPDRKLWQGIPAEEDPRRPGLFQRVK
jgi:hypothetical protein